MNNKIVEQLMAITEGKNVRVNEPMKQHTTFKLGGNADYFVSVSSPDQIKEILFLCKKENIPYYVIGNGSNLVVGDYGFVGVIIHIGSEFSYIESTPTENGIQVKAGAGIMLSKLAVTVAKEGALGFEFAAGIPGTLGGAVAMNAGAYGGEIKDNIVSATVMDQEGNVFTLSKEELELGYRKSRVQKEQLIVLEATFQFELGNSEQILETIKELNRKRKEKQPLEYPSAGSTFKRPEGYFAGKLIMDAGLRGYRVGDISVSEKHCGFVINLGNGTAAELIQLMSDVKKIVKEKDGVDLEPEVRLIGEFKER